MTPEHTVDTLHPPPSSESKTARQQHHFLTAATLPLAFFLLGCSGKGTDNGGIKPTQLGKSGQVESLAFSPDSRHLAVGSFVEGKGFIVWDVASRKEVFSAEGCPFAMTFSPDGKRLALIGRLPEPAPTEEEEKLGKRRIGDPAILLCDTATWKITNHVVPSAVYSLGSVAFHPKEEWLYVTADPEVPPGRSVAEFEDFFLLWDLKTGKERYRKPAHRVGIKGMAVSPDGTTVVTAGGHPEDSAAAKVWEAATGKELWSIPRYPGGEKGYNIRPVVFLPDGSTFATGCSDGKVRLWDMKTKKEKAVFSEGLRSGADALAVSSDGKILVMADCDVVGFWEVSTGKQLAKLNVPRVLHVALSPDGKWLATGTDDDKRTEEDGAVALWKMAEVLRKKSD
jgi:WD40 repeat protein